MEWPGLRVVPLVPLSLTIPVGGNNSCIDFRSDIGNSLFRRISAANLLAVKKSSNKLCDEEYGFVGTSLGGKGLPWLVINCSGGSPC